MTTCPHNNPVEKVKLRVSYQLRVALEASLASRDLDLDLPGLSPASLSLHHPGFHLCFRRCRSRIPRFHNIIEWCCNEFLLITIETLSGNTQPYLSTLLSHDTLSCAPPHFFHLKHPQPPSATSSNPHLLPLIPATISENTGRAPLAEGRVPAEMSQRPRSVSQLSIDEAIGT